MTLYRKGASLRYEKLHIARQTLSGNNCYLYISTSTIHIMHIKHLSAIFLLIALSLSISHKTEACTRAVYLGENGLVITGRTMDWKENIPTNLYIFPRGISRQGYDTGNTVRWTSKYGSIVASGYEMGTSDRVCPTDRHRPCIWRLPTQPEIVRSSNISTEKSRYMRDGNTGY